MADFKALVHNSGRMSQIADADSLLTGSGLKNASGNLTITPAGSDLVLAAGKSLSAGAGAGALDLSNMTGAFTTSTGAVTIGPGAVTVSGAATFSAAGTALDVTNNATIGGTLGMTGQLNANGGIGRSSAGALSIGEDANSSSVDIGKSGALTTIKGDFQIDGTETVVGSTTFTSDVTFGDANTDTVTFRAKVQGHGDNGGDIVPVADNTTGLGSSSLRMASVDATNIVARADATDSVKVMELAIKCARSGNVNAISDAMSGFAMCRAALTAAGYNVRINIDSLGEVSSSGGRMLQDLAQLEKKADKLEAEIKSVMKERGRI